MGARDATPPVCDGGTRGGGDGDGRLPPRPGRWRPHPQRTPPAIEGRRGGADAPRWMPGWMARAMEARGRSAAAPRTALPQRIRARLAMQEPCECGGGMRATARPAV